MSLGGLILEGVTGAGKTQTLRALLARPDFPPLPPELVLREEETFGEFMAELEEGRPIAYVLRRLEHVLARLEQAQDRGSLGFLLERFHLSYAALLPRWELYDAFDQRLAQLGCKIVLLSFPEMHAAERALERADRRGSGWTEGLLRHFGSSEAALDGILLSRRRRIEALAHTRLPVLQIDTRRQDWPAYSQQALDFWQTGQPGNLWGA